MTVRHVRSMRISSLVAVVMLAVLSTAACGRPADDPRAETHCDPASAAFPRTATTYLGQHNLPSVSELSRYDVVIVDQEWQYRDPTFFAELRKEKPDVCVLAYVDLVDHPNQLGSQDYWPGRYRLWQFTSDVTSTFPEQWWAETASGERVSEWPDTTMANLTDVAPAVNGLTFGQYAAEWLDEEVLSSDLWDGVYLDVWGDRIYSASVNAWDIERNGVDVPDDEIYGLGNPWERGITEVEQSIRERAPEAIFVGNGDRTLHRGLLNGLAWESFMDPQSGRSVADDLAGYMEQSSSSMVRAPAVFLTIDKHPTPDSGADPQAARFQLAATLMQNGFWAPMSADYEKVEYYPELDWRSADGSVLGPGYLGQPVVAIPTPDQLTAPYRDGIGEVAPQVFRRDFTGGIALLNAGQDEQTVHLGGNYRNLAGDVVDSVTIGGQDGAILVAN